MDTKMFDQDFTALFDDDHQYDEAVDAIFRQMMMAEEELPFETVLDLWNKVAQSEAEIEALIKQQPGHQRLAKSIEEARKKLALAQAEQRDLEEQKKRLKSELAKNRQTMHKLITQQVVEVPDQLVDTLAEIVSAYRQELVDEKKKLQMKKILLESAGGVSAMQ